MMKNIKVEYAIVGFCAVLSMDLYPSWYSSPFDRTGAFAFIFWLVPLAVSGFWRQTNEKPSWVLWVGLALSLGGFLGKLNLVCYAGLAAALAGLVPWSQYWLPWMACSVAWMPALGYVVVGIMGLQVAGVLAVRVVLGLIGMSLGIWAVRQLAKKTGKS